MKVETFLITALINIGIGAFLFFMLIISMNGFSEDEATPGLVLFIVWALISSLGAGALSFLSVKYLTEKKSFNRWLAALLAIVVFVIIGAAVNFVGIIAAVLLASAMQ